MAGAGPGPAPGMKWSMLAVLPELLEMGHPCACSSKGLEHVPSRTM